MRENVRRLLPSLLLLAIATATLLPAGCADADAARAPAAGLSSDPGAAGSAADPGAAAGAGAGTGTGAGAGAAQATTGTAALNAIGRLETAPDGRTRLLRASAATYELQGAAVSALAARIGGSDHLVHVFGAAGALTPAGRAASASRAIVVRGASTTDGIYARAGLAGGVSWLTRRRSRLFGSTQTVNILEIDPTLPGVRVRPIEAPGSVPGARRKRATSVIARTAGARAAVNGGYFDGAGAPLGFLKVDGRVLASNPANRPPRAAVGFLGNGLAVIDWVAPGEAWGAVREGMGAGPNLVTGGRPDVTRSGEGMIADLERRHPRTAVGIRPGGEVLLVTVDGRSAAGAGVTLAELARLLIVLGCDRAMNLDGGGSTTMWISGQPDDGVVSYPSDDGNADHRGERRVANAMCVFAR